MGQVRLRASQPAIRVQALSTSRSASASVVVGRCVFNGIDIKTDGVNDVTLNVYDSLSASGTQLLPDSVIIPGSARLTSISYDPPVLAEIGIYVEAVAADSGIYEYQVLYDMG